MRASYDATEDSSLPLIAEKLLREYPPSPELRNQIQDMAWQNLDTQDIPRRYRHELSRVLGTAGELFLRTGAFETLLDSLWILEDPFDFLESGPRKKGLRAQIHQHVFRNPEDWSAEFLFEKLGAFESSSRRFILFIEGLASAHVRPDVDDQHRFVKAVNQCLRPCGVEMRETGLDGGYPLFQIVRSTEGVKGKPKNIIFASPVKPDLRFRDAVNNDIEIVTNADAVLVYDRAIPSSGLSWDDLQDWWADLKELSAEDAKKTLYQRLLGSLPETSPPQRLVFTTFFRHFGAAVRTLPALLPEVWLHWDPKNITERGPAALTRFRMDFLMLLPNDVRIVIEVDGKQHYADDDRASPQKYGVMMAADREIRLAGYEVYRFGGAEVSPASRALVGEFFERLFKRHRITVPPKRNT